MTLSNKQPRCADYHVAWICPLADVELLPARLMLDEEHSTPPYDTHYDENTYICGAINGHTVVVATCPQGETGNVNAGRLTGSMFKTFPNIRMTVLVGIGGGIPRSTPSEDPLNDIHLGDIVVGWPGDGKPACVYHDRGRSKVGGQFEMVGTMQSPDWRLTNALSILKSDHELGRTTFGDQLVRLQGHEKFTHPGLELDRLFRAAYHHVGEYGSGCAACDQNELVQRPQRSEHDKHKLVFHQGQIATGTSVIQNGEWRDWVRARCDGALCVETEAAGVDVNRRCLVIRGISDYADSHKDDVWRSYAAGNAAAFARELLCRILPDGNSGSPSALSPLHRTSTYQLHLHQPPKARVQTLNSSEEASLLRMALDRLLASLPKGEKSSFSRCKSGDEMLKTIDKLPPFKADKSKFRRAKASLQNFTDGIKHFFDAIDIIFQPHAEITAIAWGEILLVLQLASNFSTFFQRLIDKLQRLSDALPQYGELVKHMKDRTKEDVSGEVPARLRSSLVSVYGNLFQFLQGVACIFTKYDASNKIATPIYPGSFWKPFESRFQSFMDSMEHHRNLLQDGLTLIKCQMESALLSRKAQLLKCSLKEQEVAESRHPTHQVKMHKSQKELLQINSRLPALSNEQIRLERQLNNRAVVHASQLEEATNLHTNSIKSQLEREQKDLVYRKILQWLSPPQFTIELDIAQRLRAEGTSEWLFEEDTFCTWRHTEFTRTHYDWSKKDGSGISPPNVIWVQGKPGAGKTVLAGATIDYLQENTDAPVLFFFFQPILKDSYTVYQSILAQILQIRHDDSKILDILSFAMSFSHSLQLSPVSKYLSELLQICLSAIPTHFIVFDGIDECVDPSSFGQVFSEIRQNPGSKVLLFSRPNVLRLQQSISASRQVEIGMRNYADIELYLERKLSYFTENGYLPENSDISNFVSRLTRGADGMFLWARLFTDFLASEALSVEERVQTVMAVTMPEKLEVMYLRLIKLICRGSSPNKTFAKWIITWLCFSKRTLTARELQETMHLRRTPTAGETSTISNFDQAVVIASASLFEKVTIEDYIYKAHVPCYRFVHITAKEFFLQLAAKDDPSEAVESMQYDLSQIEYFRQPGAKRDFDEALRGIKRDVSFLVPQGGNADIALSSLTYFNRVFPAQPLSRTPYQIMQSEALDARFPLCRYATAYWMSHLEETAVEIQKQVSKEHTSSQLLSMLMEALETFLSSESTIRTWIEASYLSKHPPNSQRLQSLTIWSNQVTPQISNVETTSSGRKYHDVICDIKELVHFLCELDQYWGVKIDALPSSIWTQSEITAFTPSYLLKNSKTKVTSLHVGNPLGAGSTLSSECLCKVSENTNDGSMVGSLSIWPSRAFEKMSIKSNKPKFSRVSTSQCASGWVARYEVWSTEEPCRRLFFLDIPLKEDEIRLHMYQSMWNKEGTWTLQFPLSISASLHQFTVLRTVYSMRKAKSSPKASKEFCILSLSLNRVLSSRWTSASYSTNDEDYVNQGVRYSYWLKFSNDGQRLLFVDAANAAVYSLFNESGLNPVLESLAEGLSYRSSQPMWTVEASFHPDLPLVAWQVGRAVFGWAYKRDVHPFLFYETPDSHWSYPRKLEFSNCGRYIVITETKSEVPIYKPIPEDIQGSLPRRFSNEPGSIADNLDLLVNGQPRQIRAIFDAGDRSIVSGSNAYVFKDGSSVGLTAQSNRDNVSVHLWCNRGMGLGFEKESWELSQLPNWEDIHTASASIRLPKKGDSSLAFILNKSAQPENNLTPHSERLPAIVRRDLDDIRKLAGNGGFAESSFLPGSSRKRPLVIEGDESLGQPDEQRVKLDA